MQIMFNGSVTLLQESTVRRPSSSWLSNVKRGTFVGLIELLGLLEFIALRQLR